MTGQVLDIDDDFEVLVAVDRERGRVGVLYTSGMERYGFPELAIEPPPDADPPPGLDWAQAAAFLAQALMEIADRVLGNDTLGIRPIVKYLGAEGVRFRVRSPSETPGEAIASLSGAGEGGEVRGVTCSWWSA